MYGSGSENYICLWTYERVTVVKEQKQMYWKFLSCNLLGSTMVLECFLYMLISKVEFIEVDVTVGYFKSEFLREYLTPKKKMKGVRPLNQRTLDQRAVDQ